MITPLDIENKKFGKQMMNGYSVEEVDDFLDDLTVDYSKNYKEISELRSKGKFSTLQNNRNNTSKHIINGTRNSRRSKKCSKTKIRTNNNRC